MTPDDKLKEEHSRLREILTRLEMAATDVIAQTPIKPDLSIALEMAYGDLSRAVVQARKLLSGVTTDETK